jgi:hypothetical protein
LLADPASIGRPVQRLGGNTYAISHASAALLFKKRYPRVGLIPLLIAAQIVELLWIGFTYLGLEHAQVTSTGIHLDYIPYSHSIVTSLFLAGLAWGFGKAVRRTYVGNAIALALLSHVVLDLIQHDPNIALLPMAWGPRFGLGLASYPAIDFIVELAFCIGCWKFFGGSRGLLIGIVIFNLLNLPLMFSQMGVGNAVGGSPALLPTLVLLGVLASGVLVWWFGRETTIHEEPIAPIAAT